MRIVNISIERESYRELNLIYLIYWVTEAVWGILINVFGILSPINRHSR